MPNEVSIVIPCRDDNLAIFKKTLDAIGLQDNQPSEIIIVDSSEQGHIKEFLTKHKLSSRARAPHFAGARRAP